MTTLLGLPGAQVSVRDPDVPEEIGIEEVATARRAINGTMSKQITASKINPNYRWTRLTYAEYTTLFTELSRQATLALDPPSGGSYLIVTEPGTLKWRRTELDDYEIEVLIKEV